MNITTLIFTIIGCAFSMIITFVGATWHISNRFGKVEGRLLVIESKVGIRGEAGD